jgi:hypothetical protein
MKLNAIIFHTTRLVELRNFYEGILNLPLGTFEKNGEMRADYNDTYVNYHLEGGLLCFESDPVRNDQGTVVLTVKNFNETRAQLESRGVSIVGRGEFWIKIKDPEGRSIILEPEQH